MLCLADTTVTSRGSELHLKDRYIKTLKIQKADGDIELIVGNCEEIIDIPSEYGYINLYAPLKYAGLLYTETKAEIKAWVSKWSKKATTLTIGASLLQRDRGVGQYNVTTKEKELFYYVHPAFILSITEVGVDTKTWLMSMAMFSQSYYQLLNAAKCFSDIDSHIESLKSRISIYGNIKTRTRLIADVMANIHFATYPGFDWSPLAHEVLSRLSLCARCDLKSLLTIKKKRIPRDSLIQVHESLTITPEKLRFLENITKTQGDLWNHSSAHLYTEDKRNGAIIVLPSGHLFTIADSEFLKENISLMRFENILMYLPIELTCFHQIIQQMACMEKTASGKTGVPVKIEIENTKRKILGYVNQLINGFLLSPYLFSMLKEHDVSESGATIDKESISEASREPEMVKVKSNEEVEAVPEIESKDDLDAGSDDDEPEIRRDFEIKADGKIAEDES